MPGKFEISVFFETQHTDVRNFLTNSWIIEIQNLPCSLNILRFFYKTAILNFTQPAKFSTKKMFPTSELGPRRGSVKERKTCINWWNSVTLKLSCWKMVSFPTVEIPQGKHTSATSPGPKSYSSKSLKNMIQHDDLHQNCVGLKSF